MGKWFLVYCKSKQDTKAEENLIRQGFDVFRPTINVVKNNIGRQSYVQCESLFPRYVFIHANPEVTSLAPVVSTFGVAGFVKFGNKYATASENLIREIKRNVERHISLWNDHDTLKRGDEVYVDGYGFDHVKAIYHNQSGEQRAMILMNILGTESKLVVPRSCLCKISS
jgi:transcriptional antiterminator RfaH